MRTAKPSDEHPPTEQQLTGTFGAETVRVSRAGIEDETGQVTEWRSKELPRYQRLTKEAEAVIATVYLVGTSTCRAKRALSGLIGRAVSMDGTVQYDRVLSRPSMAARLAEQSACVVTVEACAMSHHWGRGAQSHGHEVRLMRADKKICIRGSTSGT